MSATLMLVPAGLVVAPAYADTASKQKVCEGIDVTGTSCTAPGEDTGISGLVGAIVNILSLIVGIAAVIMLIIGGLKYVTSGGDSNAISSAKNTILYALVGVVVAVLAQFLVHFVINKTAG